MEEETGRLGRPSQVCIALAENRQASFDLRG